MIALALAAAHASPTTSSTPLRYYPGPSQEMVTLAEPWRLTGAVLVRSTDLDALHADPQIARVQELGGYAGVVRVQPVAGVSSVQLANRLHELPHVRWSHPDLVVDPVPLARPDDPYLDLQWHLINTGQRGYVPGVDVNVEEAWEITAGAGMRIAVIDSGTDLDHPDLVVLDGTDFVGGDDSSDPDDGNNHGTAVAGIAAGIGNNGLGTTGIAYEADVYAIRLVGGPTTSGDVYTAFVEAVDAGAHVINNSWGYEDSCNGVHLTSALRDAFDYAEEEGREGLGSVVVFAAGNGACDVTQHGLLIHPAVIAVSAVSGFDRLESYSNFGPHIDVTAPSGNIATTGLVGTEDGGALSGDEDYVGNFNGTSAAAPMVSGVAALMVAANPRITSEEVRRLICDTAVRMDPLTGDWDDSGWSPLYGCGRVDAGAAVRAVANVGPAPAPEIEERAEIYEDRVVLAWPEPVDPDGDALRYRVRYTLGDSEEQVVLLDRPWLDLRADASVGDVIDWRVRAVDPWGQGEWSVSQRLEVVPLPEPPEVPEPRGCGHVPTGPWSVVGLCLVVGLARRR